MAFRLALICALVATSLASPQVFLNKELKSSLHEIASRYGMSSHESFKLVSLSDPKTQILDKLNELLTELRSEQNDAVEQHNIFVSSKAEERANLVDTLNSIQGQIQDTENYINQVQASIAGLQVEANEAQAEANDADSQVKLYEAMLDRLNQDHQDAVARYADIIQRHDDSLATLQQLINMVANFQFNEALALLNKQRHQFLHRKSARIALLVQSSIQLIQKEGPKNDIKQKLLALLDQIKQGTEQSRALYVEEAQNEVAQFNETSESYSNMINSFSEQRDIALARVADINGQIAEAQNDLAQAQDNLGNLQSSEAATKDAIAALDAEVANENDLFNSLSQDRIDDMNAVEAAIQYVNDHVEGMSVHDLCHIGAPGCYRCLTSSDCGEGQECSDDGKCQQKPNPVLIGGTVNEHDTMNLVCPDDKIIRQIKFASYGMPTGDFPEFSTSWCDATSSTGVISSICIGGNSCSISAVNDVFGDPCFGTFKHMSVVAVCD